MRARGEPPERRQRRARIAGGDRQRRLLEQQRRQRGVAVGKRVGELAHHHQLGRGRCRRARPRRAAGVVGTRDKGPRPCARRAPRRASARLRSARPRASAGGGLTGTAWPIGCTAGGGAAPACCRFFGRGRGRRLQQRHVGRHRQPQALDLHDPAQLIPGIGQRAARARRPRAAARSGATPPAPTSSRAPGSLRRTSRSATSSSARCASPRCRAQIAAAPSSSHSARGRGGRNRRRDAAVAGPASTARAPGAPQARLSSQAERIRPRDGAASKESPGHQRRQEAEHGRRCRSRAARARRSCRRRGGRTSAASRAPAGRCPRAPDGPKLPSWTCIPACSERLRLEMDRVVEARRSSSCRSPSSSGRRRAPARSARGCRG